MPKSSGEKTTELRRPRVLPWVMPLTAPTGAGTVDRAGGGPCTAHAIAARGIGLLWPVYAIRAADRVREPRLRTSGQLTCQLNATIVGTMTVEEFGRHLRELRKRAGFSQRDLAQRAGIDFTYLRSEEHTSELQS